ncbi:classical arabinogalactan protein 9-like [Penaeus chinensis]|uniref:classical arabinogalactan protein 9-like n=1 Tax=Penaeus chinensis TaxID=139456 RepID=UPI001FB8239C|nr:classical arabinogalactan protein 9-like [Penaeus chinensis]
MQLIQPSSKADISMRCETELFSTQAARMKVAALLCFAAAVAAASAMPPVGGPAPPSPPSPEMIAAFIPTPEEIQALSALHTTPAPGVVLPAPVGPPTMPPAVASLVAKYKAAVAALASSTSAST